MPSVRSVPLEYADGGLDSKQRIPPWKLACHLWHPFYLALCADADADASLLRALKQSWAAAPAAQGECRSRSVQVLVVTDTRREEGRGCAC